MQHHSRHSFFLVLCLALFLSILPPAQPAAASEWPGDGWVHAGPIEGGCQSSGSCNSTTDPPISGLFEYKPDRTFVGPNEPPGGAEHGGYPTYEKREQCWIQDANGKYMLQWAAGSWHHGAYWQRVNGRWSKSKEHWAFFHKDECFKTAPGPTAAPPTPIPTGTPLPPPAPGSLGVQAFKCYNGGPGFSTTIGAWAGAWSESRYAAGVTFSVPGQYAQVSYSIDTQGWSVRSGSASGTTSVGSRVTVVLHNPQVCVQPTPVPNQPPVTPTIPPQPCTSGDGVYDGSYIPITIVGARAQVQSRLYNVNEGTEWAPPAAPPTLGSVQPGQPLEITFDYGKLRPIAYEPDHHGMSRVRWGITDLTSGQVLANTDTVDDKELKNNRDEVQIGGRTLRLSMVQLDDVSFSGPNVWSTWLRTHSTWVNPSNTPQLNKFYKDLQPNTVRFTPIAGHRYEAWAMNAHGACRVAYPRWSRAQFIAGALPTPTPDRSCPGPDGCIPPEQPTPCPFCPAPTAVPTITPLPTPTPPPPPPPPMARGTWRLRMHSRHDPLSAWTGTQGGTAGDADAINTSVGTTVSWPQGEILDWAPEITLQPLPAPPVDPWYGQIFEYRQEIVNWSFVRSRGESASHGGRCRGAGKIDALLHGCAYPYLPSPTEDDLRNMPHTMWFAGPQPQQLPADLYGYALGRLEPVDLEIEVAVMVTVRNRMTGEEIAETQILPASFVVNLVTPRSVR